MKVVLGNLFVILILSFVASLEVKKSALKEVTAGALFKIIEQFYSKHSYSLDITVVYSHTTGKLFAKSILNRVLSKTHDTIATRIENSPHINVDAPRKYNIFIVDGMESFDSLSKTINDKMYNIEGYFLVVLTMSNIDLRKSLYKIFQTLFNLYIIHVNVMYTNEYIANIYTFFPFTSQYCNKVVPVLYNSFRNESFVRRIEIFPDKLANFYGCKLNVLTWQLRPHMYLKRTNEGSIVSEGIDGFILLQLQSDFNFSTNFIIPEKEDDRGYIYSNGTATGAHKMMLEGKSNFTICGWGYTYYRATVLTASLNYYYSSIVIVKPGRPRYTSFERLFFPFDNNVWSCIILTYFAGFIIINILKLINAKYLEIMIGNGNETPMLQMFNTALGGNATTLPTENFGRLVFTVWLLANIIVRSSYQGLLFGFLQKPQFKKIPLTLPGLFDEGYKIYAPKSFVSIFESVGISTNEYEMMDLPIEPYIEKTQDPALKRTLTTTHFQIGIHLSDNWSRPAVEFLPQRVFQLPLVILYKKNSYLKIPFDRTLRKLIRSGLIEYWSSLYMNRTGKIDDIKSDPKAIGVADFTGTFILCGVLLFVAIVVFVMEIVSPRSDLLQYIIEYHN